MDQETSKVAAVLRIRDLPPAVRYAGSGLAVVLASLVWYGSPLLHREPFAIFLFAVVACARFLGFGPAVMCSVLSVAAIDYLVYEPRFSFSSNATDLARLGIFTVISLLTASVARQRSRAELREDNTRRQLAAIVESSEDAIYSTRLDGTITSWNRGAEELYGYKANEVLGLSVEMAIPPDRSHEFQSNLEYLSRGQRVPTYQTERLRRDSSRVQILLSVSPLRDKRGRVVGASSIARDITAQQQAEEALRRNEKLANAGRLTAIIAHEINNPLEAVTNLLYLARQDSSRADQHLQMAEREVQRIADIVQQTLGFVRDVAGPVPLSVSSTLDEVLQLYLARLNAKNIQTEVEFSDGDQIRGFSGELRQLFSNLIANSIDALQDGGRLRLRVTHAHTWSANRSSGIRVTIADNGAGIRAEDQPHIFEPFFTTKRNSGTGLGLWLCEGIVRKHGGSIRLRSSTQSGRAGTVFAVFLPEGAPSAA